MDEASYFCFKKRNKRNNTYRLEGKSIPGQQLVSFDLDTPFLV